MATFGRKLNENQVKQFGRKVVNASVIYGRKAGDIAERVGPVLAVTGMATGNPVLSAVGAGVGMGGKAVSNLLKKD